MRSTTATGSGSEIASDSRILGRLFFEWFQEGPNQLFELFIHAVYGLLLVPFFASALQPAEATGRRHASVTAAARPVA
jgi:carboxypeptidase C (cathepsin A)